MKAAAWIVAALVAALIAGLIAWLANAGEWVEVDVPTPPRGEAAHDRFYVAKRLAGQLGAAVTTVRSLEQMPPPGATLVVGSSRWNMFPGREAALMKWIDAGGHLVVLQSAWSTEGDTPRWVPMRSVPLRPGAAASAAAARAASAASPSSDAEALAAIFARPLPGCLDVVEPQAVDHPFGAGRGYRVCGAPSRLLEAGAPTWLLRSRDGAVVARVGFGRGDITANALEGSLDNRNLLRNEGALMFAAMLQLGAGDVVWFFDEEKRARFLSLLWDEGAAPLLLAAAALALLLWRSGTRFGPLLADAARARRSVGEQVRRTAAFIAAGGGAALHRASVRALDEQARRSIAGYAGLLGARERAEAIARTTRDDPAALASAMAPPARGDRHRLATAIARLEHARRALRPDRCASRPTLPPDASPP